MTRSHPRASADRRARNQARGRARGYPRVRARPILPGRSYKITRRCIGRLLLLSPGRDAAELAGFIGYCLAYAAQRYGVEVHATCWMSNHHHTDVTDPRGELVAFKQLLHSLIARGCNTRLGRFDSFWSGDEACDTRRPTDDESLKDLVYTLTNPVAAGLVKWARLWPGFTSSGWRFGETRVFKRPAKFFDPHGEMPDEVSLTLVRPPIFPELDDEALYERLSAEVRLREREVQDKLRGQSRGFMGLTRLAQQRWNRAPQSFEERFRIAPAVAASSKWLVLAELGRNRGWERQYAAARELMLAGKAAVFPAGTYWLRRFAGVAVRPP